MEEIGQKILEQIALWSPKIGSALVIFVTFWVISKITKKAIMAAGNRTSLDNKITNLLGQTSHYTLLVFGLISALGTLGINISALVAGLGLTGFALGFAFKDSISNLVAGVLLLIYQPFDVNDRIRVMGHEGDVLSIDLRYTILQEETTKALIPNSSLFTNPITIIKNESDIPSV